VTTTIVGVRTANQAEQIVGAVQFRLSKEEVGQITNEATQIAA
jgi:aryl-alcohol dehydrogenase-like predicted oxidoreductase